MHYLHTRRLALAAALVLMTSAPARAEYVTAQLTGSSINTIITPGANILMNDGKGGAPTSPYKAGVVNWTNLTAGPSSLGSQFWTFCIEITQDVYPNKPYTFQLDPLENAPKPGSSATGGAAGMGAAKADAIRELWGGFYNSIGNDGLKAAAFQLALWKIEYDWTDPVSNDRFSLLAGSFRATDTDGTIHANGAVDLAQQWVKLVDTNDYARANNLVALTNNDPTVQAQDQITQVVPTPPALYLALVGCAGFGAFAAWRRGPVVRPALLTVRVR